MPNPQGLEMTWRGIFPPSVVNHGLPKDLSLGPHPRMLRRGLCGRFGTAFIPLTSRTLPSPWLAPDLPLGCVPLFTRCPNLVGKISCSPGHTPHHRLSTDRQIINHLLGFNQERSCPEPVRVCGMVISGVQQPPTSFLSLLFTIKYHALILSFPRMISLNLQGFDIQESVLMPCSPSLPFLYFKELSHLFCSLCHSGLKTPIFPICAVPQSSVQFAGPSLGRLQSCEPFLKLGDEKYAQHSLGERKFVICFQRPSWRHQPQAGHPGHINPRQLMSPVKTLASSPSSISSGTDTLSKALGRGLLAGQ